MDRLQRWLSLCANLAIIGGIVFLGYELHQNNLHLEEQARDRIFQNRLSVALLRAVDPEVARIFYWQETDAPLSAIDQRRREDLIHTIFLRWQFDYQSFQRGTLSRDDLSVPGMRANWRNTPGMDGVWEQRKARYAPEFVEWLEANVAAD